MTLATNEVTAGRQVTRRLPRITGDIGYLAVAFGLLVAVWWLLSLQLRPWVPAPTEVLAAGAAAVSSSHFYADVAITLRRVVLAFIVAGATGAIVGVAIGLSRRVEAFSLPILAVALAIPDPVYIIFAILALGTGESAPLAALIIAIAPFVTNIVRSAVHGRDLGLDAMAAVYGIPRRRHLSGVVLPQLVPAFASAGRTAFALSWKIVVVVEALSRPDGIGSAIFNAFRLLRMRDMFALAILFTLIMEIIERGLLARVQRRFESWRQP